LPDTRSEAALALRSRGQVLGALTVQSDQPGAFDEQTVAVLQTMADQVAVAIDNARLYDESQAALEAERRAYGVQSRAAWAEHLRVRPNVGYYCDGSAVTPISERAQVPDSEESPAFSVPLVSRGQVIGTISARRPDGAQAWTKAESQLLETLAEQLGQALESARLYQDSLRRTAREQLVGEVTARVRETLDMETVLKVAAQELRQSLGLPEVMIRLAPDRDRD
jgi:GAF domain-containing protein